MTSDEATSLDEATSINHRRSPVAYYLFVNDAIFLWRATLSQNQIIVLSTAEAELMALARCCCEIVWARKWAIELGFPQLKPTDVYEDNTGCIALANNMHFRGRSEHITLRVLLNNASLRCKLQTQGRTLCLAYLVKTSRINSSATSTLATNDPHSALPKPLFHLVCDGRLINLYMALSYFASASCVLSIVVTNEQGGGMQIDVALL